MIAENRVTTMFIESSYYYYGVTFTRPSTLDYESLLKQLRLFYEQFYYTSTCHAIYNPI